MILRIDIRVEKDKEERSRLEELDSIPQNRKEKASTRRPIWTLLTLINNSSWKLRKQNVKTTLQLTDIVTKSTYRFRQLARFRYHKVKMTLAHPM